jgi:O-antigen/teichoic acid export membrane protein
MSKESFFRHAAVYGLANLLVQAGSFILVPIYTRCLTPADYGVLEVVSRLAETVGTCLLFGGFRQALLTFYQQAGQDAERRRIISSTLALFGCTCLGGVLVLGLAGPLSGWLSTVVRDGTPAVSAGLVRLAILGILLEPLTQIPLTLIQARLESATYVALTVSQFVVRVTLLIVVVRLLNGGVAGALAATALTAACYGVGLSARELARSAAWPDGAQVRALLRFALPLMPGGLCFFLLHHGDRFFLLRYCPADEVGTYALGYKLALGVGMFSLNPLYMVWSAHMYEVARSPDAPQVFGRAFTRILAVYLFACLGVCLFEDEVVAVLGGAPYARAAQVVAPVLLACFCQAAASLMDAGLYVRRRTGLKLGITLSATAVMLLLYALLIPRYGGMGAAVATLGGFAFLAACTWWTTQRVFPVRYEWPRLVSLLCLAFALWLAARALPPGPWAVPAKAGLWLLGPVLVWQVGLMSAAEKQYAHSLACQAYARVRGAAAWARRPRPAAPAALPRLTGPRIAAGGDVVSPLEVQGSHEVSPNAASR